MTILTVLSEYYSGGRWPHYWTSRVVWSHGILHRQVLTKAASKKNSDQSHCDHRKINSCLEKSELKNAHRTPPRPGPSANHRLYGSWWLYSAEAYSHIAVNSHEDKDEDLQAAKEIGWKDLDHALPERDSGLHESINNHSRSCGSRGAGIRKG